MQNILRHQHESDIKKLQAEVWDWQQIQKRAPNSQALSLAKASLHSNTTRSSGYKKDSKKLPIDGLNRILSIDNERLVAVCEPRVSMKELAETAFKHGLIPLVVPEFKGITVGGAIMGCGGESSSHKYGLFHDICNSFEILVGDGRIVRASSEHASDLFDGIVGSYGSLGVLLSAEVRLQKALPWVTLQVHRFTSGQMAIQKMQELMHQDEPPEYLEGIVLSDFEAIIIEGNQSETPAKAIFLDGPFSPWYYQYVQTQKTTFSVPLLDYLFRYDRGAFWMGAYVIHTPILKKLFTEGIWKLQAPKLFTPEERLHFSKLHDPNALVRAVTYPFTSSQRLYSLLHSCEEWVKDRFVVQDFTLPVTTVGTFLDAMSHVCPIYPLWLCPVKAQKASQIFAPHNLNGEDSINIGVYGIPSNSTPLEHSLRQLEQKLTELKGRKWLYTHSCYTHDEFWNIYAESTYRDLRQKYSADGMWITIENKVLSV